MPPAPCLVREGHPQQEVLSAKAIKQFRFLTPNEKMIIGIYVYSLYIFMYSNIQNFNKIQKYSGYLLRTADLKVSVTCLRDNFGLFSWKSHREARRGLNLMIA